MRTVLSSLLQLSGSSLTYGACVNEDSKVGLSMCFSVMSPHSFSLYLMSHICMCSPEFIRPQHTGWALHMDVRDSQKWNSEPPELKLKPVSSFSFNEDKERNARIKWFLSYSATYLHASEFSPCRSVKTTRHNTVTIGSEESTCVCLQSRTSQALAVA